VQLAGHKKMHSKPFPCDFCQRPFAALYAVRAHMEICNTSNFKKHICDFCGASYARSYALTTHIQEAHKEEIIEVIIEEEVNDS
jgi:KRAB domain-containing zinc finger protein